MVCTGNTCRSPLAAGVLQKHAANAGLQVQVDSAGTGYGDHEPAASNAIQAAQELGVDLGAHRSRRADAALLRRATLILTMEPKHVERVLLMEPRAAGRTFTISQFAKGTNEPVSDPYQQDLDVYRACAAQLDALAKAVVRRLCEGHR